MIQGNRAAIEVRNALVAAIQSIQNGITVSSGGYNYDLLGAAALLQLSTPYTDWLPRKTAMGGLSAQWWEFMLNGSRWNLAKNAAATAGEGQRGGSLSWSGTIRTAAYKSLAIDADVTDEARLTTEGIIDPLALNQAASLLELKRGHHIQNIGGRSGYSLGTANTPSAVAVTSGGVLADATYYVYIVPINNSCYQRMRGYPVNGSWAGSSSTGTELLPYVRNNGGGSTTAVAGGTGIASAVGSATISGGSGYGSLTLSWTPLQGTTAYAVFIGTTSGAANAVFQGITTACKYTQTVALKTLGQALGTNFASDLSVDPLEYDGLLTLLMEPSSPALIKTLSNGTSLSSSANMQLDQIDSILAYFYTQFDGYGPAKAWCSGSTKKAIELAILSDYSASRATFLVNTVNKIRNPYTQQDIEIVADPYIPDGKLILAPDRIPSKVSSSITEPVFFRAQQDYKGETWPRTSRLWANGVSLVGTLCTPWRAGHAVLDNIAA